MNVFFLLLFIFFQVISSPKLSLSMEQSNKAAMRLFKAAILSIQLRKWIRRIRIIYIVMADIFEKAPLDTIN